MKKVLFIATVVKTHISVFHLPYIKMFKERGYKTVVAAKNDYENGIPDIPNCDCYIDIPFARNPFSFRNIKAYKMLKTLIDNGDFDVVECNTPVGGVVGRLAARKARKKGTRVIYIAHGFHFSNRSSALLWLVFYPIEKLLSYITDVLVTINKEDYDIALKHFKAKSTIHINGIGVELEKIESCVSDKHKLRSQIGIKDSDIMLVSVGELRKLKNHITIIKAMSKLNNPAIHYVIAGSGSLKEKLEHTAETLGVKNNVHLLGFCTNVYEILKASDIFCFPSLREGMPVSLMEAMAAGLPAVVSTVRGNTDLIVPNKGGFLYSSYDVSGFAEGIQKLVQNPELRYSMGYYNKDRIKDYDIKIIKEDLSNIYFPQQKETSLRK
ncbi:MAG: glycosyltransferase family 4 protein [Firmicutes bacterium]|nr:glycosyltransferase family 4 protein [Bacillota bacterium]